MIFNLNNNDINKLNKLFEIHEFNEAIDNMYLEFLFYGAKKINKEMIDKNGFLNSFMKLMDIEKNDTDFLSLCKDFKIDKISKSRAKPYLNNNFTKNIKIRDVNKYSYKLTNETINAYEPIIYKDIKVEGEFYREIPELTYLDEAYTYPSIKYKNTTWMSLIPHEINTMQESIDEAKGDVLVYGLGLGYYSYMVSNKKEVSHVTIVEIDNRIIELFKENILPQFPNKDKITILEADAFKFTNNNTTHYDYAFFDLYHDADDGLELYTKMKKLENKFIDKYSYWIETTLLASFRRLLINLINEEFNHEDNVDYTLEDGFNDHVINSLHNLLQNTKFNSYNDIYNLLSDKSLIQLISNI